jgi:hypothetical protein
MTSPKKRVKTLAANGKVLYQVEFSKVVLRKANRPRFDIVGFAALTACKRVADFCRYVVFKNGVASILQEMLQESPRDGASDVSSYWPGPTASSAIINHHTTGKGQIANVGVLNNTDTPMAKRSPNSLNDRGLGSVQKSPSSPVLSHSKGRPQPN